jgi:hypothetical protein
MYVDDKESPMPHWDLLGEVPLDRLLDARLQMHWAAQPVSAVGKQLLDHRPDWSEQSFRWLESSRMLAQDPVSGPAPFRAALRLSPPALAMLGEDGMPLSELPLDGRTLAEMYEWTTAEAQRLLGRPLAAPLEPPGDEMPGHAVGQGARFTAADTAAFEELARWYGNFGRLFLDVAERHGGGDLLCWPHNFDLAVLIDLEGGRSIGIGLEPADRGILEPYIYVNLWPYPAAGTPLPEIEGGGSWHTEGWSGTVLLASRLLEAQSAEEQAGRAGRYVESAVAACRKLLGEER